MNDIKSRIKSVEGTMQITKAMELVATSKLRHAKERAEAAKPYMSTLGRAINNIALSCAGVGGQYTDSKREGKTLFVVIAGDRGLAGGYNSNVFKLAASLDTEGDGIYLPIGKKTLDYFRRRGKAILSEELAEAAEVSVGATLRAAELVISAFNEGVAARVVLVYTKFVSMLTQTPVHDVLIPITLDSEGEKMAEPIFEGDPEEIFQAIMPQYIGGIIYGAVCEAVASECGARRTAMNSANKNAEEMISDLRLKFNRARQAVITQEITEIVSGAEAL